MHNISAQCYPDLTGLALRRFSLLVITIILTLSGLVSAVGAAASRQFNQHGIAFEYPADWKVTSVEKVPEGHLIFVEDPTEGITGISAFNDTTELSLEEYTENCFKNISTEIPPGAKIKLTRKSVGPARGEVKFVLSFMGVELPTTMSVSLHTIGRLKVFCMTQIADEDRHLVQAGFDQIRRTLASAK